MRRILSSLVFLCLPVLPLSAQEEALHGTWEGSFVDEEGTAITMRLSFKGGWRLRAQPWSSSWEKTSSPLSKTRKYSWRRSPFRAPAPTRSTATSSRSISPKWKCSPETGTSSKSSPRSPRRPCPFCSGLRRSLRGGLPGFRAELCRRVPRRNGRGPVPRRDSRREEVTYAIEGDTLSITSSTEDGEKRPCNTSASTTTPRWPGRPGGSESELAST